MKKIIGVFLLLISTYGYACDVCGCGSGAFSQGMLNTGRSTLFGIRSTHRWYQSYDPEDATRSTFTNENFNSLEVFGRINIGKRFQTGIFISYVFNQQTVSSGYTKLIQGLGDIVLMQDVIYVNTKDSLNLRTRYFGTAGLGAKFPTGKHIDPTWQEPTMMPGTGSFDFNVHATLLIHFKSNWGLQHESAFTFKTENKEHYRFGNSFSTTQVVYYQHRINDNWKIVPQLGLNYQFFGRTRENGIIQADSYAGGAILNASINFSVFYKDWTLNLQGFIPLYQHLSQGYVQAKPMLKTGIIYTLKTKEK